MKYEGEKDYKHGSKENVGVLITNLGTPDKPKTKELQTYLKEFLSDPRVIEVPKLFWQLILRTIILNLRPKKVAKLYKSIWKKEGGPLLVMLEKQKKGIIKILKNKKKNVKIEIGMRYGNPSIKLGLEKLRKQKCRRILILPLYPQYCAATTGSTFDRVTEVLRKWRWIPEVRFINNYFEEPLYLDCLIKSIKDSWQKFGKSQKLIFSYHGVPKKYLLKGDPYHCFCQKTTRLVVEKMKLKKKEYMTTFQSRFGPDEWLQPYTDKTLENLPSENIKKIHIISPGFSSDCLETLEELEVENKEIFMSSGGKKFNYIKCLNDNPEHLNMLALLILNHLKGWPGYNK
jgi:ferrochelatase